jgi:phage-related minor tail protein
VGSSYNRPDPSNWEVAWEQGVSSAKKQGAKVVGDVKTDVLESLGLVNRKESPEQAKLAHQQLETTKTQEDRQKLASIQRSIAQIDERIKQVREERTKKWTDKNKKTEQVEQQKKYEEKKKEAAWQKAINGSKGTKEGVLRVSG